MNPHQVRPEIASSLNFEYQTTAFTSSPHTFLAMIEMAQCALKKSVHYSKYGITFSQASRYSITFDEPTDSPFQAHQQQFLHELASTCERVISDPSFANVNIINQFIKQDRINVLSLNPYYRPCQIWFRYINIKQALVFTALSQCQVWYTICRQRKKSKKEFDLDPLINYFHAFVEKFNLTDPFHPSILPKKQLRNIEKKVIKSKTENQLYEAVYNQDYELAKKLLQNGAKVEQPAFLNTRQKTEVRCTHRACLNKDLKMCKLLDSFNANWEAEDSEKMSPLFYAIQSGSLEIIKYLLQDVKVNIQKHDIQSRTPFYWACTQGDLSVIDYLYKAGANINHKSELGRTALSKSCYLGRKDIVLYLLSCEGIDMYSQCKKGRTALHNAVFGPKGGRQGHKFGTNDKDSPECAQILLERGMDVDILDFEDCTSLHVAMSSDAVDSVRLLMAYGASLTARNNYKEVPLMTGAKFGHTQSCQILWEEYNCSITDVDMFDKNILLLTAKFQQNHEQGSETNPVFLQFLRPFIQACKDQGNIKQLHRTFYEMITNQMADKILVELHQFWTACEELSIPRPELAIEHIEKILQLSIVCEKLRKDQQGKKKAEMQEGENRTDFSVSESLRNLPLQDQKLKEISLWLIRNNDTKVLEFVHERHLLHLNKIELDPKLLFELIEDESLALKEKIVTFCLLSLHFDWLSFKHGDGSNIIHLLVRKQRMGCLVQLFKALSGRIPSDIMTNKYLSSLTPEEGQKILQRLLSQVDSSGLDAYQLSLILKNKSMAKMLEQRIKQQHLQVSSTLDIGQYEAVIEADPQILKAYNEQPHEAEQQLVKLQEHIGKMKAEQLCSWLDFWRQMKTMIHTALQQNKIDFWKESDRRPLYLVQKIPELAILKQMEQEPMIGIDLEYFNQDGITIVSTLQISSITQDVIIDCLSCPLPQIRSYLQPILHSPRILKIMHGSDNDLILIKSSFNLSLINFVDTSRLDLELRANRSDLRGLSTICKEYLGLTMSKQYQVSEWRIRPLPRAMLQYARKDSLILPHLFVEMISRMDGAESVRQFLLGGCRQVRKNRKASQPLIAMIRKL